MAKDLADLRVRGWDSIAANLEKGTHPTKGEIAYAIRNAAIPTKLIREYVASRVNGTWPPKRPGAPGKKFTKRVESQRTAVSLQRNHVDFFHTVFKSRCVKNPRVEALEPVATGGAPPAAPSAEKSPVPIGRCRRPGTAPRHRGRRENG